MPDVATARQSEESRKPRIKPSGVLTNSALVTVYAFVDAALLFVLTVVLGRYLGVADFGKYAFAMSYGLVLWVFSDPGISLTLTKLVARDPDPENQSLGDGLSLRLMLVVATCTIGLLPFGFNHYLSSNALVLIPFICSEQIRGLTLTLGSVFRGFQVMLYDVIATACERVVVLGGVLWALQHGHGLEGAAWAFFGGRVFALLIAAAIFWLRIGRVRLSVRPRLAGNLIRESMPLATLLLAERINLYYVPIVLTAIAGEYSVGLFNAALKIVMFPILLTGTIGQSLFPAMSAAHGDREKVQKLYRFGVRVIWHLLLPGAVLTAVFAPEILRIIYGAQFVPAARVLQWLTAYFLIYALTVVSYYLMPAVNQQRVTVQLAVTSILINLLFGPLFMWGFGVRGAAVGLVVTNVVVAATYWYRAQKLGYHLMRMRADFFQWGGFILTLAAAFALRLVMPIQHWYQLLAAAALITATYFSVLLITRSLLPEELQLLRNIKSRFGASAAEAAAAND